jgi:hypothetical protein
MPADIAVGLERSCEIATAVAGEGRAGISPHTA